jgi:hypothetical protein
VRGLAIVIALSSCGRIGFDPGTPVDVDARSSDGNGANDASDAPSDGPPSACQTDARYRNIAGLTSRYRTVAVDLPWDAARSDCEADGAHLTILDDANEAASNAVGDWVGITDETQEGTWRTIKGGVATFLPWQSGQPDGNTTENCARLDDTTNELEDRACTDSRDYSCECE